MGGGGGGGDPAPTPTPSQPTVPMAQFSAFAPGLDGLLAQQMKTGYGGLLGDHLSAVRAPYADMQAPRIGEPGDIANYMTQRGLTPVEGGTPATPNRGGPTSPTPPVAPPPTSPTPSPDSPYTGPYPGGDTGAGWGAQIRPELMPDLYDSPLGPLAVDVSDPPRPEPMHPPQIATTPPQHPDLGRPTMQPPIPGLATTPTPHPDLGRQPYNPPLMDIEYMNKLRFGR